MQIKNRAFLTAAFSTAIMASVLPAEALAEDDSKNVSGTFVTVNEYFADSAVILRQESGDTIEIVISDSSEFSDLSEGDWLSLSYIERKDADGISKFVYVPKSGKFHVAEAPQEPKEQEQSQEAYKPGWMAEIIQIEKPVYSVSAELDKKYKEAKANYDQKFIDKATPVLIECADAGHPEAQYEVSRMYKFGKGVSKNKTTAWKYMKSAADAKEPRALYELGLAYLSGTGVKKNTKQAFDCFKAAAYEGHADAQYKLATWYTWYEGSLDASRADNDAWLFLAARGGHGKAARTIASNYANGWSGYPKDLNEAVKWYSLAADNGDFTGIDQMGYYYSVGEGVPLDKNKALAYFKKAAENNYPHAMCNYGVMFENGWGTDKNPQTAVKWYEKGASRGETFCQSALGKMYLYGNGIPKSGKNAVKYLEQAAKSGNVEAMTDLAYLYGESVTEIPINYEKARIWYTKAAERGHAVAMNNLGVLYDNGRGVKKDRAEGCKWFTKAAEAGSDKGRENAALACAAAKDAGNSSEKEECQKLRVKAESGDISAMNDYGVCLELGKGGEKNPMEASMWYLQAAEGGNAIAMKNIGLLYELGNAGFEKNAAKAREWYLKAQQAGKDVTADLKRLESK